MTRESHPRPVDDQPAGSDRATGRASNAGLDAFASEHALPHGDGTRPATSRFTPADQDDESAWGDDDFVVRFPETEPLTDADLLLPPVARPRLVQEAAPARAPAEARPHAPRTHTEPARVRSAARSALPATGPAPVIHVPTGVPQDAGAPANKAPGGARRVIAVLSLLLLVQAAPTYLWVQGRLGPQREDAGKDESAAPSSVEPAATTGNSTPVARREESVPVQLAARRAAPRRPAPASSAAAGATSPAVTGVLAVDTSVPVQVVARDGTVGTSGTGTIRLPAGTHDLEFRNDTLGYRTRRTVALQAGRTTRVQLPPPMGKLHANAIPWAEIWIDNARIGETPIGNVAVPVGQREIVFRHPELGERRTTVLVTLKEPARVSVDLRQP